MSSRDVRGSIPLHSPAGLPHKLAHSFWLVALTYAVAAVGIRWVRASMLQPQPSVLSTDTQHN
jgi:hypothetical protein